jgi:hypothetical protein
MGLVNPAPPGGCSPTLLWRGPLIQGRRKIMADKQIVFSDQEQQQIEGIVIDKDKDEALRYLTKLVEWIKGHAGQACGPGPIK